jgi:energy-coupling factor transporter ATP-binding protein EcfA2
MTNLLGLRVEQYKAITLFEAEFSPDGGVVALMGKNGAGKSSVLDALESLIAGRRMPKAVQPVKAGAHEARVIGKFDDITVERIWKNGTTSIKVIGARNESSDEVLARLYSHISLDPLAFAAMDDKAQTAELLKMIGFDPTPLNTEYANRFAQRTTENAIVKSLKARLDALPPTPDTKPVNIQDLSDQLQAANITNKARESAEGVVEVRLERATRAKEALLRADNEFATAQRVQERCNEQLAVEEMQLNEALDKRAATPPAVDLAPIYTALSAANGINASHAAAQGRTALETELIAATKTAVQSTTRLIEISESKAATLAAAKMPVPGLTIDPETERLMFNGTAFADESTGIKARTGFLIGMMLNPDLKLTVIRDASNLDAGNRAMIDQLAKANGFTVLMEIVDENAERGIVITDGSVTEIRA